MPPALLFRPDRSAMRWLIAAVLVLPLWRAGQVTATLFGPESSSPLSDHSPNVWSLVQALPGAYAIPLTGLAMAASAGVAATIAARWVLRPPRPDRAIDAALLVALIMAELLPSARYDFLPAMLCSLGLLVERPRRSSLVIALPLWAGLALSATGDATLTMIGAMAMIAATTVVARPFLVSPANDNGLPLNPFHAYPG